MTNFTELFTATLNDTLEKMVTAAVAKVTEQYEAQLVEMQGRIMDLEENATQEEKLDIDGDIEKFIEQYDFSTVVQENVDFAHLCEGPMFADAVKVM